MPSLRKSKKIHRHGAVCTAPGNGGIAGRRDPRADIAAKDGRRLPSQSEKGIDFAVVAPDDPLVLGMVDALNAIGIPCFA